MIDSRAGVPLGVDIVTVVRQYIAQIWIYPFFRFVVFTADNLCSAGSRPSSAGNNRTADNLSSGSQSVAAVVAANDEVPDQ